MFFSHAFINRKHPNQQIMNVIKISVDTRWIRVVCMNYWVTHKSPQISAANHATFPIQWRKMTVQICGNFWVTQNIGIRPDMDSSWFSRAGFGSVSGLLSKVGAWTATLNTSLPSILDVYRCCLGFSSGVGHGRHSYWLWLLLVSQVDTEHFL